MPDNDRPGHDDQGDSRYYGPFGPPPDRDNLSDGADTERTAPLGIGSWSYPDEKRPPPSQPTQPSSTEETRVLPSQPGPSFDYSTGSRPSGSHPFAPASSGPGGAGSPWAGSSYPPPQGYSPIPPAPPQAYQPVPSASRRPRLATLILLAALIALLVGSAAGYGGSRLAQRSAVPAPQLTSAPTVAPSPSASSSATAPSTPFTPAPGSPNTVEVAKAALPSTVMILVGSGTEGGTGSGFVLDNQGHIMTNNHVVQAGADGGRIRVVYSDGTRTTATLVGRSPSYDLAVIKVSPSSLVKPMRVGNSDQTQVGEPVIAIGSPLALPGTVTAGIVSAKDRPVVVEDGSGDADAPSAFINAIQTDAPINPGNSGGPLIDDQARVIGVNSAILTLGQSSGQSGSIGLGFAIPINQAMEIGQLLIKKGKATYPVIGANVESAAPDEGVKLSSVESGGPADKAGLETGDIVTAIDGNDVSDIQQLIVRIRTHRPGEQVELTFNRNGSEQSAQVTLGSKEG